MQSCSNATEVGSRDLSHPTSSEESCHSQNSGILTKFLAPNQFGTPVWMVQNIRQYLLSSQTVSTSCCEFYWVGPKIFKDYFKK